MNLKDEVAIVTGAAQGLGKEIALRFAREGASIIAADIQGDAAKNTAKEIITAGGMAVGTRTDVSVRADVSSMVKRAVETYSKISILVNDAGIFPRKHGRNLADLPEEEWDRVIDVNLKGGFLCSSEVMRVMAKEGRGSIINLSSSIAFTGHPDGPHYAASKAGILGLTKSLALAWAPLKIRVNAIAPGLADTAQPRVDLTEEQLVERGRQTPLGRIAKPSDVAGVALFLASKESSYITGQTIHVNGGSYLW